MNTYYKFANDDGESVHFVSDQGLRLHELCMVDGNAVGFWTLQYDTAAELDEAMRQRVHDYANNGYELVTKR